MKTPELITEMFDLDFVQRALKSKTLKAVCLVGLASTAIDSYIGLDNLNDGDYKDTASSALHVPVEFAVTAALLKLRKLEPQKEFVIGQEAQISQPQFVSNTLALSNK